MGIPLVDLTRTVANPSTMEFPTFDLNGRVAIVTGSARALGCAISLAMAHGEPMLHSQKARRES